MTIKTINVALQGGGAHGAFAWGVLDKLLEDGRIAIEGVCATSAGTMNALALGYGLHLGARSGETRERARECLAHLWRTVSDKGDLSPVRAWRVPGVPTELSPGWLAFDSLSRAFSPYQWNPFDLNPLRDILDAAIDFESLRRCKVVKLFISATNVRTGKVRVFGTHELSIDVALASACLPNLFRAVEIGGEAYWDGGYMGNPALFPLFNRTTSRDVMIIHINPVERPKVPITAPEIFNRINEISFNSSLLKELRAIAFVKKLIENDMLKDGYTERFKDILVHSVRADEAMCDFSVATKFDTSWRFLTELRDRGRETMAAWLDGNFHDLNVRDSVDLDAEFAGSVNSIFDVPMMDMPEAAQ